jgi:hypothetical protein
VKNSGPVSQLTDTEPRKPPREFLTLFISPLNASRSSPGMRGRDIYFCSQVSIGNKLFCIYVTIDVD